MQKIKVIQISHASMSYFLKGSNKTLKQFIIDDWFSLTAQQIKKFYPKIEIECWCPERTYKKQREFIHVNIKYRQFPTTFSPIYALDFSTLILKALKEEVRIAKEKNIKLVLHLHEYHNLHGLLIATLFKDQIIIAQHHGGSWPLKHAKENKKYKLFSPLFLLAQIWENLTIKNIRCFYALTPEEINYLKKRAPNSKIKFQTMGIESHYFNSMKKSTARKKLKLSLNKKIIVFLGRINYIKGIPYLLEAMKKLKEVDLKIIGYGPQKEEFENYVKSKKLKNVEFLGPIFGDKKLIYLSAADALVLPSTKEGASVVCMEAMARNIPCISTDIGGMPLMIKTGKNGILVRQKNSSDIIKAVREILKWKGKNIRKSAEVYKWEKIVQETVKDYIKI